MCKRALTYFLLLLIALQSVVAIGDAHQLHQQGTEHLTFDETHQHDEVQVFDILQDQKRYSDSDPLDNLDCHHCCHCHGHLCPVILVSIEQVNLAKISPALPDYAEKTFPETYETFLRPPKA